MSAAGVAGGASSHEGPVGKEAAGARGLSKELDF